MPKFRLWTTVAPAALLAVAVTAQGQTFSQSYPVHRLQIDSLIANLKIVVDPSATGIKVDVKGDQSVVQTVHPHVEGDALVIAMDGASSDWWAQMWGSTPSADDLEVDIIVPAETPTKIANYIGDAVIGDLKADLDFNSTDGNASIGEVTQAKISVAGSGDVALKNVTGKLDASISGSGSVKGLDTKEASIDIAGNGDVDLGVVDGSFTVEVAGSGDVSAKSVNGRVAIDVAGSGDVKIDGGLADPLKIDIAGSGDVRFAGTANNPVVSVMGSGDVWIQAYTGTLNSDGAEVKVGSAQ